MLGIALEGETAVKIMESTVHLLPHELFVATISKDSVSGVTHSILRLLLRLFSGNQESRKSVLA